MVPEDTCPLSTQAKDGAPEREWPAKQPIKICDAQRVFQKDTLWPRDAVTPD